MRRTGARRSVRAILVHDINDDRCTGCDACVAVCPTNVLDLVANKSRVLRFQDCIQCEACMFACPTEALVMFPEGARAAAAQGPRDRRELPDRGAGPVPDRRGRRQAARQERREPRPRGGRAHAARPACAPARSAAARRSVDVAIVGSGPGGLSAALSCIQRGLSYVVLEKEQDDRVDDRALPEGQARDGRAVRHAEPVAPAGVRLVEGAADPDLEGADRARRHARSTRASRSRRSAAAATARSRSARTVARVSRAARRAVDRHARQAAYAAGPGREPAEDLQPARRSRRVARQERARRRRW